MTDKNLNIIDLRNVNLSFKNNNKTTKILENINLKVNIGETLSISGPSGSGKTSLMMLIAGIEKPTSGNIIIDKKDITNLNEDELAKIRANNISIVFQNFHLIPNMTALENVELALDLSNNTTNNTKNAKNALKSVGLSHRANNYPDQLSGGEQQRVALARSFVVKPKILLCDEPTGNLDSENGKIITDILFNLQKENNTTLILITHDKNLAKLTKRQFNMLDGKLNEK